MTLPPPYPESAHPYADSIDDTQTYTAPVGTAMLYVLFDPKTSVESGSDFIYIRDGSNVDITGSPFTGTALAGQRKVVTGATLKVRLTSDVSFNMYGYRINRIGDADVLWISSSPQQRVYVQKPYSFTLSTVGSVGSVTWSVASGALPAGLSLNASTGVISGAATYTGNVSVSLKADDGTHTDTVAFTFSVLPAYLPLPKVAVNVYNPSGADQFNPPISTFGPWEYNGKIFVLGIVNDSTANGIMNVSSDYGLTWTIADSAHLSNYGYARPYRVGNKIIVIRPGGAHAGETNAKIIDFDLTTETWGSFYGTTGPGNTTSNRFGWVMRNDLTALFIYHPSGTSGHTPSYPVYEGLWYATWNGTTWTPDLVLETGSNSPFRAWEILGTALDPVSGNVQVLYNGPDPTDSFAVGWHRTIFPDGTKSAKHQLPLPGYEHDQQIFVWNGHTYLMYWDTAAGRYKAFVDDAATPSSFSTTINVSPVLGYDPFDKHASLVASADGLKMTALYAGHDQNRITSDFEACWQLWETSTTNGTTWTTPVLRFDGPDDERPYAPPSCQDIGGGAIGVCGGTWNDGFIAYLYKLAAPASPCPSRNYAYIG